MAQIEDRETAWYYATEQAFSAMLTPQERIAAVFTPGYYGSMPTEADVKAGFKVDILQGLASIASLIQDGEKYVHFATRNARVKTPMLEMLSVLGKEALVQVWPDGRVQMELYSYSGKEGENTVHIDTYTLNRDRNGNPLYSMSLGTLPSSFASRSFTLRTVEEKLVVESDAGIRKSILTRGHVWGKRRIHMTTPLTNMPGE